MDKKYSTEDFKTILNFLKLSKAEEQNIFELIKQDNLEEAAEHLKIALKKYLKDFESVENYKLKVIESDLLDLDKEESVLESDFNTEFENFYHDRYEKVDKKIDEQYEADVKKMDEIDQKVKAAINRLFEAKNADHEQQKITELRKTIGANDEE